MAVLLRNPAQADAWRRRQGLDDVWVRSAREEEMPFWKWRSESSRRRARYLAYARNVCGRVVEWRHKERSVISAFGDDTPEHWVFNGQIVVISERDGRTCTLHVRQIVLMTAEEVARVQTQTALQDLTELLT